MFRGCIGSPPVILLAQPMPVLLKPCHHPLILYIKDALCYCATIHLCPLASAQSLKAGVILALKFVSDLLLPAGNLTLVNSRI